MFNTGFNPLAMSPMGGMGMGGMGLMGDPMGAMGGMGAMANPMGGMASPMGGMASPMGGMGGMSAMLRMQQQMMMMSMMTMLASLFQGAFGGGGGAAGGLPEIPNFGGGGGSPASGGLNNFLGGGGCCKKSKGGGGPKGAGQTAAASAAGDTKGAGWGKKLAEYAKGHATGSGGYCYKYVGESLRKFGVQTSGMSAYMAGDQLAKSKKFREVKMSPSELKKLPAGAVVVWNKGGGHPHGHISIADGKGKEYSDVPRDQITTYGTSVRVFLPK